MFKGSSARAAAVRKRIRFATVYGHGMLDLPKKVQEELLATMLDALPLGKSRDDVLMASHYNQINIDDVAVVDERTKLVDAYNGSLSRQAAGKAKREAEEAKQREFEAWKATKALGN